MKITLATLSVRAVVAMMFWLPAHAEVTCSSGGPNEAVPASTPSENFIIKADGTAIDTSTGLMWMRCNLHQAWDGSTCVDIVFMDYPVYTWQRALLAARDINSGALNVDNDDAPGFATYTDWRLPNKNELASIIEEQCWSPTINETVFPGASSSPYWSSSPYINLNSAWSIDFRNGTIIVSVKDEAWAVRLVRDIQ
jgi:hypothetical protein